MRGVAGQIGGQLLGLARAASQQGTVQASGHIEIDGVRYEVVVRDLRDTWHRDRPPRPSGG